MRRISTDQAAHRAAREGAARGEGAPASDRAGVWGGAPRWFVALLVVTLGGVSLLADTLVFRDGRRVQGELRSVRDGIVEFVEQGFFSSRTIRVNVEEIERIEFDGSVSDRGGSGGSDVSGSRPRGLREKDVSVAANVAWNDTGIDVRDGRDIFFEARGRVRWGPNRRDGAAGENNSPTNANRPMPRRPAAALIGKIGVDSTEYFFIGDDQGAIRMRARGRLYLGINDDYLQDNRDALTVTVYY